MLLCRMLYFTVLMTSNFSDGEMTFIHHNALKTFQLKGQYRHNYTSGKKKIQVACLSSKVIGKRARLFNAFHILDKICVQTCKEGFSCLNCKVLLVPIGYHHGFRENLLKVTCHICQPLKVSLDALTQSTSSGTRCTYSGNYIGTNLR